MLYNNARDNRPKYKIYQKVYQNMYNSTSKVIFVFGFVLRKKINIIINAKKLSNAFLSSFLKYCLYRIALGCPKNKDVQYLIIKDYFRKISFGCLICVNLTFFFFVCELPHSIRWLNFCFRAVNFYNFDSKILHRCQLQLAI